MTVPLRRWRWRIRRLWESQRSHCLRHSSGYYAQSEADLIESGGDFAYVGFESDWFGPCWMAVGRGRSRRGGDLAQIRWIWRDLDGSGEICPRISSYGGKRRPFGDRDRSSLLEPAAGRCCFFLLSESFGGQILSFYPGKCTG